jgi:hypothetical protein
MSEENVEVQEQETSNVNPAVERAMNDGWRPIEEWDGPKDQWVDYGEFNFRGELMSRISEQSSVIHSLKAEKDEIKTALAQLAEMQDKIAENEYKKIMNSLRREKVEAIEEGDGERVAVLDEQIDDLKEARSASKAETSTKPPEQESAPEVHPEIEAWISKPENSWYNTDPLLHGAANSLAAKIAKENPSYSPATVLREMEREIKKEMPHKFRRGSNVTGGDQNHRPDSGGRKRSLKDLNTTEQEAGKRFVKLGVFKHIDEYIQQLDAIGD